MCLKVIAGYLWQTLHVKACFNVTNSYMSMYSKWWHKSALAMLTVTITVMLYTRERFWHSIKPRLLSVLEIKTVFLGTNIRQKAYLWSKTTSVPNSRDLHGTSADSCLVPLQGISAVLPQEKLFPPTPVHCPGGTGCSAHLSRAACQLPPHHLTIQSKESVDMIISATNSLCSTSPPGWWFMGDAFV